MPSSKKAVSRSKATASTAAARAKSRTAATKSKAAKSRVKTAARVALKPSTKSSASAKSQKSVAKSAPRNAAKITAKTKAAASKSKSSTKAQTKNVTKTTKTAAKSATQSASQKAKTTAKSASPRGSARNTSAAKTSTARVAIGKTSATKLTTKSVGSRVNAAASPSKAAAATTAAPKNSSKIAAAAKTAKTSAAKTSAAKANVSGVHAEKTVVKVVTKPVSAPPKAGLKTAVEIKNPAAAKTSPAVKAPVKEESAKVESKVAKPAPGASVAAVGAAAPSTVKLKAVGESELARKPESMTIAPVSSKPAEPRPAVDQKPTAPIAARPAAPTPVPAKAKPVTQKHNFKLNEYIVYPAHGVGQIIGVEIQEVAGFSLELFVVSFIKDKMILKVPTSRIAGMRKLAEGGVVDKALGTLSGRARIKRTMWSRRAQEYEAKINSGDLVTIAEVVRDLYRSDTQPEQSYSERQLYEAALDRMAREIAVVRKLIDAEALKLIESFLQKGPRRGQKSDSVDDGSDDGDDVERAA